jgi:hypothetical protein
MKCGMKMKEHLKEDKKELGKMMKEDKKMVKVSKKGMPKKGK